MNPRLVAINGSKKGTTFLLTDAEATIGRESNNTISLRHASISRRHCVIRNVNGEFRICDLDSYNGTFVNGIPIKEQTLGHADQVRVGNIALLFLVEEGEDAPSGHLVRLYDSDPISETSKIIDSESLLHQTERPERERAARDLSALLRIATRINRLRRTRELVHEILDSIFEIVPVERGAILLTQGDKEFSSVYGKHRQSEGSVVQVSRTVVERVVQEGLAILANDIKTSDTLGSAESLVAAQISSLMCVPLIVFEKILGVIYLDTTDPLVRFDEDHLQLLAGIAGIAAVSLENARQMEWLEGENSRLRSTLAIEHNMIGESAAMQRIYSFIQRVAPARSAVLICGESGTGKELAAHAIHVNSPRAAQPFVPINCAALTETLCPRAAQPFVPINCAALTETLLESELFGHEKGAFTGAITKKDGKLAVANGGTVFFHENGDMPLVIQSRLFRVFHVHKIELLWSTQSTN